MKKNRFQTLILIVASAALLALLAACKGAPPKKPGLELRITTTADLNPDIDSRPSPIVLHILQLTDTVAFDGASYVELTRDNASALGSDALSKTEVNLVPGDFREVDLILHDQTAHLGFVAGYRNAEAKWRISEPVRPGKTDWIAIRLDSTAVSITEVNH